MLVKRGDTFIKRLKLLFVLQSWRIANGNCIEVQAFDSKYYLRICPAQSQLKPFLPANIPCSNEWQAFVRVLKHMPVNLHVYACVY